MKTGLSGWVLAIARTLDASGVPHEPVFDRLGMDARRLKDGTSRYSQEMVSQLWRAAVDETGDIYFGLKVASQLRPSSFHVVGYSMSCSEVLGDALRRFAHYAKLISSSANVELVEHRDRVELNFHFDTGGLPPSDQALDTVLAGIVCFSSWLVGCPVRPIEVQLKHPAPPNDLPYKELLKCSVKFGQEQNRVVFQPDDMERPILSADEHLAATLDTMAINQMAELSGRFSRKVRECLKVQFATNDISKKRIAELLHMTERTLLRRLKEEGTTYQEVLDGLREEIACEQLRLGITTIQGVSTMLGFSDASTFSRAFKRWTGRRPSFAKRSYQTYNTLDQDLSVSSTVTQSEIRTRIYDHGSRIGIRQDFRD